MSRCIFCEYSDYKLDYCEGNDEELHYFGMCRSTDKNNCAPLYTLEDDIKFGTECNRYKPRPQDEIDTIKAGLKLIGINVEE